LSLRIYLDESAYSKRLVNLLRNAGHEIVTPYEAKPRTIGQPDVVHFDYAREHGFILLTKDPYDFERLHHKNQDHCGTFAIYQQNDPTRDMSYKDIIRAISNIEASGIVLRGGFHVLNAWLW
jgi:predicted nuclease of predicted toxin-antitoxin system